MKNADDLEGREAVKAIIMAGGQGTRLRPLTCDCPKPMLPLMGRPLMRYAVDLLHECGVTEIAATLGYLPEVVTEAFGGELRYYIEKTPLGTAGSVRAAAEFLGERFIVLSGDGIADFDLAAAVRFHEEHCALATLILKACDFPQEYGVVCADADGRIQSFHEKPGRCDVISNLVNTGAYILEPEVLERIPKDRPFDFGHDLFPMLVAEGQPVYGWETRGYWCDVGDIGAYLRVHRDALRGKIHLPGLRVGDVYISPDAVVEPGAVVADFSVVGAGCRIEAGASVKRSVLFDGVHVRAGAQLRGCAVGTDAVVGEGAQLFEESVVGSRSEVGARACLHAGVKLWPGKALPGGEHPEENVVWGFSEQRRFENGALLAHSPAQCSTALAGCVTLLRPREILIARAPSSVAAAMWHAAASGAMAQGARVIDGGVCAPGQLRHTQAALRADCAVLVMEDRILLLNARGAIFSERECRGILRMCARQDFAVPFSSITRTMQSAGDTELTYVADLAALFEGDARQVPPVCLCCADTHLLSLAERAFERAGLRVRTEWNPEDFAPEQGEIGIVLSTDGGICMPTGFDEPARQLMCAWTALESGETSLLLPPDATRAIDELCARRGAEAEYLPGEHAVWMNELAKRYPAQFRLQFDGIACALAFLSRLTARGISIREWRARMPRAYRVFRDVAVPREDAGRMIGALAKSAPDSETGGGVRFPAKNGWAWLAPNEADGSFHLMAEGRSMEAARELFDFYDGRIGEILKKK